MSELQTGVDTGGRVATLDGSIAQSSNILQPPSEEGVDKEAILKSIRQPISRLLPVEPISAFALCRLAGFNATDHSIQPESFAGDRREQYANLLQASPMAVPEGILIDDLDEYLAAQGKRKGDEFHFFAFAIANPKYRLPPVVAWCPWAKIKDSQKKSIFVPYHLLNDPSLPVCLPCLTGRPESRDLRFHKLQEEWDPTFSILVTDLE
jgi:hypothetical protein